MQIRVATSTDAGAVAELLRHLGHPADADLIPDRLEQVVASGGTILLGCDDAGVAVGLVGLQAFPVIHSSGPVGYITALVVAPSSQGRGVGRALVQAAQEWARRAGCVRMTVTSGEHRAGAHAFYTNIGFEQTGRRFTRLLDAPA